jgi:hypothetical protein
MTFTTVPDKTAGDVFTEAMWDTYIRDNLNAGVLRPIADSVAGGAVASFDFTSIPATFAHLVVFAYLRADPAATFVNANLRLNNDSGSTYDSQQLVANGTVPSSTGTAAGATTSALAGRAPAATAPASAFSALMLIIPQYVGAVGHKSWLALSYDREVSGTVSDGVIFAGGGQWLSTAAVSRLTLLPSSGNWIAGSRATLLGVGAV